MIARDITRMSESEISLNMTVEVAMEKNYLLREIKRVEGTVKAGVSRPWPLTAFCDAGAVNEAGWKTFGVVWLVSNATLVALSVVWFEALGFFLVMIWWARPWFERINIEVLVVARRLVSEFRGGNSANNFFGFYGSLTQG